MSYISYPQTLPTVDDVHYNQVEGAAPTLMGGSWAVPTDDPISLRIHVADQREAASMARHDGDTERARRHDWWAGIYDVAATALETGAVVRP